MAGIQFDRGEERAAELERPAAAIDREIVELERDLTAGREARSIGSGCALPSTTTNHRWGEEATLSPRFAYVYFMKDDPERVRATVAGHVEHWHALRLDSYLGGPSKTVAAA